MTWPATKYPNVYVDTSGYKSSRNPRGLIGYLRGHGRRKTLFGPSCDRVRQAVARMRQWLRYSIT